MFRIRLLIPVVLALLLSPALPAQDTQYAPQGEQIFTLKGADQVYRTLVEAMNEGAVSLGSDHTVLFCNGRFAEMIQTPLEKIIGAAFPSFIVVRRCSVPLRTSWPATCRPKRVSGRASTTLPTRAAKRHSRSDSS